MKHEKEVRDINQHTKDEQLAKAEAEREEMAKIERKKLLADIEATKA